MFFLAAEARDKLNKIMEIEQEINRCHLIYKTGKAYDFKKFKTISFER